MFYRTAHRTKLKIVIYLYRSKVTSMPTVKYLVRGKANPSKINIRFLSKNNADYRISTPLVINPDYFSNKTGKVRKVAQYAERETMQSQLNALSDYVIKRYNQDIKKGLVNGSGWLRNVLDEYFNTPAKNDLNFLHNYAVYYSEKLKIKRNDKTGEIGTARGTLLKYITIAKKINAFDKYKRKKHLLTDVNNKYRNAFLNYLLEVENLGRNTAGRYIKFLKTVCLDAQKEGYTVSPELAQIKGFTVKVDKIYLSFDELERIEQTPVKLKHLEDAKDWLIIGCYVGQRVGDLLSLTEQNITNNGNLEFIEITQQKTKKRVSILVHPKVKEILNKRGGKFPKRPAVNLESAKTIFNRQIKTVCKIAGLTEKINGAKVNPDTNRKENGIFEKWELITSHICRRSFASNYYGEMPTALIMNITGHSTEKEFLNYIGKTNIDYAEQMAKYWNMESQKQNIKEGKQNPFHKISKAI